MSRNCDWRQQVQHVETRHTPCHSRGTEDPSISRLFFFDSSVTYITVISITGILKVKEVKWSRYRPGMAQRVGRGIALLFHDRGTRKGWVVSSTPRPHFTPGEDPVPIVQEAGWAPGPVWTGRKSRSHRDSILREYYSVINFWKSPLSKPGYQIFIVEREATSRKLLIINERDESEYISPKFHPKGAIWHCNVIVNCIFLQFFFLLAANKYRIQCSVRDSSAKETMLKGNALATSDIRHHLYFLTVTYPFQTVRLILSCFILSCLVLSRLVRYVPTISRNQAHSRPRTQWLKRDLVRVRISTCTYAYVRT